MVGTTAGLLVFLILLLFAVQAAVSLSARSFVTAAAYDAARDVAAYRSSTDRAAARVRAEERLRDRLGDSGARVQVEWIDPGNPDVVRLRIVVDHPSLLPAGFGDPLGITATDRTIEVRVERWQQ
jgi:hypothetical protein